MYHATVLLSCNALVVTLSLPLIFAAVLKRSEITQLYMSVPGASSQTYFAIKVGLTYLTPLAVRTS